MKPGILCTLFSLGFFHIPHNAFRLPITSLKCVTKLQSQRNPSLPDRDGADDTFPSQQSRRDILLRSISATTSAILIPPIQKTNAQIIDETAKYANDASDSAYAGLSSMEIPLPSSGKVMSTDEIDISIPASEFEGEGNSPSLGIELGEVIFRTNRRIFIKTVSPDGLGAKYNIPQNFVLVGVNGESTERTDRKGVAIMVSRREKGSDLVLRLRDPGAFQTKANDLGEGEVITTQIAPAGDTTQRRKDGSVKFFEEVTEQTDQKLSIEQLKAPAMCRRKAQTDDLLEISYIGRVLETGDLFDGSTININGNGSVPGRAGDISLFFVLGKQPFGQFPPGWDVGLVGMCVGERRRVTVPPVLAYGSKGIPRRKIPPNATLVYDITLISINGLAMPQ